MTANNKKTITIDPITRIEGHAKITIFMNDDGSVDDAQFHVTQFRGFEKFVEGRPFTEMPAITARICGICPVSHLLASAKACDKLLAVSIPPAADKLRRVLNLSQFIQSHALSFFHLCSPDLLLGMDTPVAERHVLGVAAKHPEIAKKGIRLRQFGQQMIEWLAGRRIHPAWLVPGGVNKSLDPETRDMILKQLPEIRDIVLGALDLYRGLGDKFAEEISTFANFPSLFIGLVTPDGSFEHYNGNFRVTDAEGKIVADQIPGNSYAEFIGEATLPWTYLKMPYYKPLGLENGMYRVGPMARLNVAERMGTPEADAELQAFKAIRRGAVLGSFHYHHARLIEILHGVERIGQYMKDDDIISLRVRAEAEPNALEGIGVTEAPRGMLVHHYRIDEHGLLTWANLIIASGHNNGAMNRGIKQAAKHFVHRDRMTEGALNRVEAVIRCFDPCLSCSTHALGQMPLRMTLVDARGNVLDEHVRD